ncbi:MAG: glycosyltransferase family 2 protein [Candidatus Omnitrophota bacterium]|nr:glycosyltransferase family 2 protein [Candidatus Omnitrophota bacterium]
MENLFIISFAIILYIYIGYPVYAYLCAKVIKNAVAKDKAYKPFVSIVFSVYNEEAHLVRKIDNLLAQKYPRERIEILIGSDGSADGAGEILSRRAGDNIHVFLFEKRRGKVSVLNEIVPQAKGEIIVFCDVRQMFDENAINELVANFSDTHIGCVSGELIFSGNKNCTGTSEGVGVYWNYEKFIRKWESAIHSMVGATGAIYAIRKELYTQPPANTILDDVYIPLSIARRGYRCIWEPAARAYDAPAYTPKEEYRRKVRTLAGNYQIFCLFFDLLVPFAKPVNMALFSHKLLRVIAPFFLFLFLISNIALWQNHVCAFFLIIQAIFYGLALTGYFTSGGTRKGLFTRICAACYMFCLMNFTAVVGLYRFLFKKQSIAWEKASN